MRDSSAAVCVRFVDIFVLGSRLSTISAIAALGCFLVAAGTAASYALPSHFGQAVVQGPLSDEAPASVDAPEYAAGVPATAVTFAAFFVTTLLVLREFVSRGSGVISATAIRPPPVA